MRLATTPDGRRLEVRRRIDAAPDRVWAVFTDTTRWPEWGPSVTAVDKDCCSLLPVIADTAQAMTGKSLQQSLECPDRLVREGSTGRVRTPLGVWLPFTVRSCTGKRWTWDVAGVPATGHRVEPLGTGSLAVFELPPLAVAYAPVCRRALDRIAVFAAGDE